MTKKLVWRLSTKPTVDEITKLLEAKIIDTKEAKELLLREDEEKAIDLDQLKEIKEEIKFLRGLVLEISKKEPTVVYPWLFNQVTRWEPPVRRFNEPWWGTQYAFTCKSMANEVGDAKDIPILNTMMSNISSSNKLDMNGSYTNKIKLT